MMNTTELLKKVRRIEIKSRGLSSHLFSGEYHSAFKGRGMAFSEVREYQYGDDVRQIDWNVSARTNKPHIKVFEEERELTLMLLIDVSGSTGFGTSGQTKSELFAEIAATLAFSALSNNDKVGAILFSDKIESYLPPRKGKSHVLRIIRDILNIEQSTSGTNLDGALRYLNNVVKKKSIAVLLSDFQTEIPYEQPLRSSAKKHDLIGINVFAAAEQQLPDIGLVQVIDPETGQHQWLDTSNPAVRKTYQNKIQQHHNYFRQAFKKTKAQALELETDQPYTKVLDSFFKSRAR